MHTTEKKPQSAANAQGASQYQRLDCVAQQDFTPNAIDAAIHLAMTAMVTARCLLVRGDIPASVVAAQEASRAITAALDSMSVWMR